MLLLLLCLVQWLHCTILSVIFTYREGGREGDTLSLSLPTQRDNRQAGQVETAHSLNYQSTGIFAALDAFPAHLVHNSLVFAGTNIQVRGSGAPL